MADIKAKCDKCGKEILISEYAAVQTLPCQCGGTIAIERPAVEGREFRLKSTAELHSEKQVEKERLFTPLSEQRAEDSPHMQVRSAASARRMARERRREKISSVKLKLSIALFVLLGAAAGYFRYKYGPVHMPRGEFEKILSYGLWALGAAYLLGIIIALKDNMFDGLLAIVVPFYSFYYLFAVSTAIFVKAIVGALLIGFGYDGALFLQKYSQIVFNYVNSWIRSF